MRKWIRIGVVLTLWIPTLAIVGGLARGASDLAGYVIGGVAASAQWTYDNPEAGIPASPTGELSAAFAETDLDSGPSGYGLASMLWPGQTTANVPGFIGQTFEQESGGQCCPFEVPNYPVRAETFYPQGPTDANTELGGSRMTAQAREQFAEAAAHVDRSGFPGLGESGAVTAFSRSSLEGDLVVSESFSSADDVSLLGGFIEIDSVVTRAKATSDGRTAEVSGRTVVIGARVDGNEVSIDNSGVHVFGEGGDPGSSIPAQQLQAVLAENGLTIIVADPIDTIEGPVGSRSLGGLLIRFDADALRQHLAGLPEDLRSEIEQDVLLSQDVTLSVASAAVTAGASEAFDLGPVVLPTVVSAGTTASTAPTSILIPPDVGGQTTGSAPSPPTGGSLTGDTTLATAPTPFEGVPVPIVVLLVVGAMIATAPMVRLADRLLAPAAGGCPYGKA